MAQQMLNTAHAFLWGPCTLALFAAVGLYFTAASRFFQLRRRGLWLRCTLGTLLAPPAKRAGKTARGSGHGLPETRKERRAARAEKNLAARGGCAASPPAAAQRTSAFESFATALAGTLGTGNIIGVATALTAGGSGAVFWMWVSALLGMMTGFAENALGILYRRTLPDGSVRGGPMQYIAHGLGAPRLAAAYAALAVLASFGMGNLVQANSLAGAAAVWHLPPLAAGIPALAAAAVFTRGGAKSVGRAAGMLVPAMALCYLLGAAVILVRFAGRIPAVLAAIFADAFGLRAAAGGAGGYAVLRCVRYGAARGIFSNEAGLGSTVLAHAHTAETDPARQGMWSICEVWLDTSVLCTVTALCILCTGACETGLDGAALAAEAFTRGLGPAGGGFLAAATVLFAFSTLLSWSLYGAQAAASLWGARAARWYRLVFLACIPLGCTASLAPVWALGDCANALMALPNLAALLALRREALAPLRTLPGEGARQRREK